MTQEDLENNLKVLMATPFWGAQSAIFDKKLKPDNLAITHMQCIFFTGGPLMKDDGFKYDNKTHLAAEQQLILKEFILKYKTDFTSTNTVEALGF